MADPFIGRTIGKYRLDSEIGRGGMGVVYHGHQTSLNRDVAVKVLPATMAGEGDFLERFRQEAQVIAALEHENIVRVYDVEEDGGSWFIIMELVRGRTLRDVRLAGPMPLGDICAVGAAVGSALGYAHSKGIVHRDVKSGNIMITAEGRVKLMDFGIARAPDSLVKTAAGTVLGTPEYMAPEQGRFGEVSPQTDIYSLGVVLFEMATGRLPFDAPDPFAIVLKHVSEPVPSAQAWNASVPDWLEAVVARCLAKMPDDRYPGVEELEAELRQHAATIGPPRDGEATPTLPMPTQHSRPKALDPTRLRTRVPLEEKVPTTVVENRPETVPAEPPPAPQSPVTPPRPPSPTGGGVGPTEATRPSMTMTPPPSSTQIGPLGRRTVWIAAVVALLGLLLLYFAFGPDRSPDRPEGVGIPAAAVPVAASDEPPPRAESPEAMPEEGSEVDPLGEEARQIRLAFLLSEAQRHLAEGNEDEAIRLAELILESEPEHEGALELLQRIEEDARRAEQAAAVAAAAAGEEEEDRADEVSAQVEPPRPAKVVEETPKVESPPVDPQQRVRELWILANRQKDDDHFHSLRGSLDELLELDPNHEEARKWRSKVDRWARNEEDDLRDDLDEWLSELDESIEDEEMDDLEKLWRGHLDRATADWVNELWDEGGSLKVEIGSPQTTIRDNVVDFHVQIRVLRKKREIESFSWHGRLEKLGGDPFFTLPLR